MLPAGPDGLRRKTGVKWAAQVRLAAPKEDLL